MAELSVKIEYASRARLMALQVMRMAFPLWGIIPVLMVVGIAGSVWANMVIRALLKRTVCAACSLSLSLLFVILSSLLAIRVLERSKLLIDKTGMEMPLELALLGKSQRYLPWKNVVKVMVASDGDDDKLQKGSWFFS